MMAVDTGTPVQAHASLPLSGLTVLGVSRVRAGPYCGQLLADLGADVIKVESPQGDENRAWGTQTDDGMTCNFASVNRGKRSITLNLKSDPAKAVLARLVRSEEHTSELQSLMRISYAVFCLNKKTAHNRSTT